MSGPRDDALNDSTGTYVGVGGASTYPITGREVLDRYAPKEANGPGSSRAVLSCLAATPESPARSVSPRRGSRSSS